MVGFGVGGLGVDGVGVGSVDETEEIGFDTHTRRYTSFGLGFESPDLESPDLESMDPE